MRGEKRSYGETHPWSDAFSLPPDAVGEVWALTVQSQLSPTGGHMTSSENEPRAACQEWDTVGEIQRACPHPLLPAGRATGSSVHKVTDPALLPGNSPGPNRPFQVHVLEQPSN